MVVTDQLGRRAGYDHADGRVEEVPGSSAWRDGLEEEVGGTGSSAGTFVSVFQPTPGTYRITVVPKVAGEFEAVVAGYAPDGSARGAPVLTGVAGPDAPQTWALELDPTGDFTLTMAPAITSTNATTFTVGTAGTFTVTATGSPTPTLSSTGALPAGVTFNAATGMLAGTPAAGTAGSYPLTFTAANGSGPNATQSFTLTVAPAPEETALCRLLRDLARLPVLGDVARLLLPLFGCRL